MLNLEISNQKTKNVNGVSQDQDQRVRRRALRKNDPDKSSFTLLKNNQ